MMTKNFTDENVAKIAELFPDCVTEAAKGEEKSIDFDLLKQELSKNIVDGPQERYRLDWPGKREALVTANTPITKTLRPCPEESVDFDETENLFIEGDNLEALKLLQNTYLGKVKMIYIDPPYNTGKDFVYSDNFTADKTEFLQDSGQVDEEGGKLVANLESNGRFHSDWLSMMYPRLKLARNLLRDDGVIFISIDDNEQANLKRMCDEVFGEDNFVAIFPWRKRTAKSDVSHGVSQDYEWTVCYAKSDLFIACIEGNSRKYYESPDFPNRPWRIHDMTKQTSASERPNSFFDMINPKDNKRYPANPNSVWRITKDTFQDYYDKDRIIFPGDYDFLNISNPVLRYFQEDDAKKAGDMFGYVSVSTNFPKNVGMTQDGTKDIAKLFKNKIFMFPKPVSLVGFLIKIVTSIENDAIVLDFFAGSATTAHAVMQLNAEDASTGSAQVGKRKFIMVQIPEECDEKSEAFKAGYKTIAEISKERIRRAGKKIKEELELKNANGQMELDMDDDAVIKDSSELDIGFRVLKVDSSNMADVYYSPEKLKQDEMMSLMENIKADRTAEDLLFQVLLDWGVDLTLPITREIIKTESKEFELFFVDGNSLAVCFAKRGEVDEELCRILAQRQPQRIVFRDSGFADDDVKIDVEQIFKQLSPHTDVKTI